MTQPRLVGGRYELGELVGYGGMAEVHRGRDTRLNREVAIKVLRADLARDPAFLNRFRREAHSAAGLNHPAIVAVYDTGEDVAPDGTPVPFIVMEYVEGRTLRDILKAEGRLPGPRALQIVAQICGALDFSHRNGIIHRDIKPANVMITPNGAVKVMDFGIARAVADTAATITQTANVIGTAQYLSPEQARGEAVDARSDVYSTGCLLYELVTGVPPFQGDSPVAVAYQHVRENPVPPSARNPELPRVVDSIVMKALAKNQFNRYQTAGEMGADVERALADRPVVAEAVMTDAERTQFIARTPPPPGLPARPNAYELPPDDDNGRRSAIIWVAVVVALLLVIGVAAYLIFARPGSKTPTPVAVPSVVNQNPAAAETTLSNAGFVPKRGRDTTGPCDNGAMVDDGAVCLTSPAKGTMIAPGRTVFYRLKTTALKVVPFVEGDSFADAANALSQAGLKPVRVLVNTSDPAGSVLSQNPPANTKVAPGSDVRLRVSTGKVKLADVTGMTFADAKAKLNRDFPNVVPDYRTTHLRRRDQVVFGEDPTPGLVYGPDQTITLTTWRYVAAPPPCISSPSLGGTGSSDSSSSSSSSSSSGSLSSGSNGIPYCSSGSSDSSGTDSSPSSGG